MRITANLLARTLQQIVKTKKSAELEQALDSFSKFLMANGWSSESKIKKIFSVYSSMHGVDSKQEVIAYSARSLSAEEKDLAAKVATSVCGQEVEINNRIKAELIGGIVLEGFDWRYSADVKSNLSKLRANLVIT